MSDSSAPDASSSASSPAWSLASGTDPRTIITPDAFTVDQSLMGTPLARPWRRLVALLIDFLLAAMVAKVDGALVGLVVAVLFFRVATRSPIQHVLKRWARTTAAFLGALALFITAVAVLDDDSSSDDEGLPFFVSGVMSVEPEPDADDSAPSAAASSSSAPPSADSVLALLRAQNIDPSVLRQSTGLSPVALDALASRDADLSPDARADAAAALQRYADALAAADTVAIDTLQAAAAAAAAGPRLRTLRERLDRVDDANDALRAQNDRLQERLEEPSFAYLITALGNDLGLTFGWIGIYFTLFLAWWEGQTPGKYLMGIRVVRLNGEPLSLWFALERFGGYAAGIVTGFLGFLQVYWDPNRQGIHDRIARTVVIRTEGTARIDLQRETTRSSSERSAEEVASEADSTNPATATRTS